MINIKKLKKKIQPQYDIIIYDIDQKNEGADKTKVLTSPPPPKKERKNKKLNKYKNNNNNNNKRTHSGVGV